MKILHVIPSVSPKRGGPSQAIWNQVIGLQNLGVEIDLIATDDDGSGDRMAVTLSEKVVQNGISIRYFPKQTNFYTVSLPLLNWLKKNIRNYDLVHIHALFSFSSTMAAILAGIYKVPYIIRPLGTLNRWGREHRRPFFKYLSIQLIEKRILNRAAAVHFTTEDEQAQAEDLGINENAMILPLGFDVIEISKVFPKEEATKIFPNLRGYQILLFLSRVDPIKGLETLFYALNGINPDSRKIKLVVAGDGQEAYVAYLKNLTKELGISEHVFWTGFVSGETKAALLGLADLFILPSQSENFGIAVVEALAAGLPVITTDGVAIHNLVESYEAGLVLPVNEIEPLQKAVVFLLNNPSLCKAMSERGRRLAVDNFSQERVSRSLVNIYNRILKEN